MTKETIATYYSNARELVKQNNPKAARAYVLAILNYALETYNNASSILVKAKTQIFMDKWIEVSRQLYDKGITDYVLTCFGLPVKEKKRSPEPVKPANLAKPKKDTVKVEPEIKPRLPVGEIDITGLIDDSAKTQGWLADLFANNKMSVVKVSFGENVGTGFIISDKGYLLTNDHVVFDKEEDRFYSNGKMSFCDSSKNHKLDVMFSDKKSDVALCSFNPEEVGNFTVIKRISDYSALLPGADCLLIGNILGRGLNPFGGTVRFPKDNLGNLVYTAPANPGDSGGPVLNRFGECIGIHKSQMLAVDDVPVNDYFNATPMDKIDELLKKWCEPNGIIL